MTLKIPNNKYCIYLTLIFLCLASVVYAGSKQIYMIETFTTRSTHKLVFQDTTLIEIGPFIHKGQIYVVFNPAINIDKFGKLICIARFQNYNYRLPPQQQNQLRPLLNLDDNTKQLLENIKSINCVLYFPLYEPSSYQFIDQFSEMKVCNIQKYNNNPKGFEDARLFTFKNEDWIYAHYYGKMNDERCTVVVKPVMFMLEAPDTIVELQWSMMQQLEKNWLAFEFNGKLYFEYSLFPHVILECDPYTGNCEEQYSTETLNLYNAYGTAFFEQSFVGGGAPAKLFTDSKGFVRKKKVNKTYFLGLGHIRNVSSLSPVTRKNFFYVFQSNPPFQVMGIGHPFDIIDANINIEFGSGMIIDNNQNVTITFGVNDKSCYKTSIHLDNILQSLTYENERSTQ